MIKIKMAGSILKRISESKNRMSFIYSAYVERHLFKNLINCPDLDKKAWNKSKKGSKAIE